jgi:Flp pilus assembly pilin Flp
MAAHMNKLIQRFLKDDSGVSSVECVLIVTGIFIAMIAVVNNLGDQLNTNFASQSAAQ